MGLARGGGGAWLQADKANNAMTHTAAPIIDGFFMIPPFIFQRTRFLPRLISIFLRAGQPQPVLITSELRTSWHPLLTHPLHLTAVTGATQKS
jgi:hypothetical protein